MRVRWSSIAIVVTALCVAVHAEIIDRVLAVAAGELIMLSDVTAARDLGLVKVEGAPDAVGPILSKLIDRELVLAEVDRYAPPEPTAEAVARELADVRATFSTRAAFDAALARSGIDENHLRETLRQNLRIRAYEDQRFTVPPPGDDEIARYYAAHPASFMRAGQLVPFETARPDVVRAITDERRTALVTEWVNGLRRRAEVILLPVRP
jgi:hypothetical protein